ncbi:hypothetical protein [Mesorhizobium sp.]|uniref:hypothetical protein n=1 Tax=Mesorhizobium sp. TaxID=1871066 RepID=UPI000FE9A531|nr:hypothetical protein [Mesorhizobium sp.]RWA68842.1 MAG: hypothetical protein EOQ29_18710 [Mesorhizobium sp.]
MDFSNFYVPALTCLFGAALQELSHWYQLRTKLQTSEYNELIKSNIYWLVTTLMVVVTPVGVLVWFSDSISNFKPRDFLLFGASFPLVFKSAVAAAAASQSTMKLGPKIKTAPIKTYLGL